MNCALLEELALEAIICGVHPIIIYLANDLKRLHTYLFLSKPFKFMHVIGTAEIILTMTQYTTDKDLE